ncbi:glycosyltransferase family 2 protein [Marinobacter sp. AL4B]|uniref:glycosyltransferase family 2 protein n=1 Tax=Marinobacter sp. AL4B TaxID=2871173 RepID=UPI001CAA4E29|nr:glycosyltransferase family A protein [Marinobacter sp. AL4B]MBZ0333683.1 glycosyltransferase family 2 protein [Marinobacter sp. AL4B]
MPKASIIVPAYNAAQYISKTLDSILNQSFQDFEIIIIDDGSSDQTASIIDQYDDPRIRYHHQANSGKPAIPRNRAIKKARGEFIFIFDSDDIMLPEKLATTIECMEQTPQAGLAFTGFACIDEGGHVINPDFLAPYQTLHNLEKIAVSDNAYLIQAREALKGLAVSNYLGTSGVAIRRGVFEQVGGFDEDVRNSDDYLMWQAVASRYDFIYIPAIFHQYRVRSGSISLRSIEDRAPGLIACTEKMMQYHAGDPTSLNHLQQRIGRFHFEVGYSRFKQQEMPQARKALIKALIKRKDRKSLFYLLLACLPPFILGQLKQLKTSGTNS